MGRKRYVHANISQKFRDTDTDIIQRAWVTTKRVTEPYLNIAK